MEGKTQETAAAKAGMSVRSARKWQSGPLPSQAKPEHRWRTRPNPFDGVWEDEIEPLLRNDPTGKLKATTIIDWLAEQHPGRFSASQLRTLQRRLQDWRALHGPDQEVYFPQVLFQLILSHSGWRYAEVAAGETFLALQQGLQNALWTLGGVPEVCAATIPRLPLTNCAAAAAALLTTITPPCWTTMASAPPASIPARAMKTASPSTLTTA